MWWPHTHLRAQSNPHKLSALKLQGTYKHARRPRQGAGAAAGGARLAVAANEYHTLEPATASPCSGTPSGAVAISAELADAGKCEPGA